MAKLEKLVPGQILYDVHKENAGNTTMKRIGCWEVRIISIDLEKNCAMVSWNMNEPKWMSRKNVEKLRVKEPEIDYSGILGLGRIVKRDKNGVEIQKK